MTDSEIIKALEYCANHKDCDDGCPCVISESPCVVNNPNTLFDLINRQQAEIDHLNIKLKTMRGAANGFKAEIERLQKAECSFAEAGGKLVVQYKQAKEQICRLQADKDTLIRNYANCQKELLKEFAERVKTAFYEEFDELIPSIMADKIDEIYKEMVGENNA